MLDRSGVMLAFANEIRSLATQIGTHRHHHCGLRLAGVLQPALRLRNFRDRHGRSIPVGELHDRHTQPRCEVFNDRSQGILIAAMGVEQDDPADPNPCRRTERTTFSINVAKVALSNVAVPPKLMLCSDRPVQGTGGPAPPAPWAVFSWLFVRQRLGEDRVDFDRQMPAALLQRGNREDDDRFAACLVSELGRPQLAPFMLHGSPFSS